jgi:hypothetical protein
MALDEFRQLARGWLLELAQCVWPEEHVDYLQAKADSLKEAIRTGYDQLPRCRRAMERLSAEITEQEQKAITLPWQVEAFLQVGNRKSAWRVALELDQVREALTANRAQLAQMEREYRACVAELEQQRQALGAMQLRLLRLRPGELTLAREGR